MATPTIQIDGTVSGAGTPGASRDDLVLAETLSFTDPANGGGVYAWTLRDKPVGSAATLSGAATATATLVPDVEGTYVVSLLFGGTDESGALNLIGEFVTTQGAAAVKLDFLTRIPSAGETKQFGNKGWQAAFDAILRRHDAIAGFDKNAASSGPIDGGAVTRTAGLGISIALGTGHLNAGAGSTYLTWILQTKTLPASEQDVWIYIDSAGDAQTATTRPASSTNILLARASTSAAGVPFLQDIRGLTQQIVSRHHDYAIRAMGPISVTGVEASENAPPSLQLDVSAGTFYASDTYISNGADAAITFTYWYKDGAGGWKWVTGQAAIDPNNYDDGSGTLAALPGGKWKQDGLMVAQTSAGPEYHVVYSQDHRDTQLDAERGLCSDLPPQLCCLAMRIACVIVQQGGADIASVVDRRPRIGQHTQPALQITDHGLLAGLADDDHTQYQKESEKDAASGYAGLNASAFVPKALLGGLLDIATTGLVGAFSTALATFVDATGGGLSPPSDGTYIVVFEGEASCSGINGRIEIAIGKATDTAEATTAREAEGGAVNDPFSIVSHTVIALLGTDTVYGIARQSGAAGNADMAYRRLTLIRIT